MKIKFKLIVRRPPGLALWRRRTPWSWQALPQFSSAPTSTPPQGCVPATAEDRAPRGHRRSEEGLSLGSYSVGAMNLPEVGRRSKEWKNQGCRCWRWGQKGLPLKPHPFPTEAKRLVLRHL